MAPRKTHMVAAAAGVVVLGAAAGPLWVPAAAHAAGFGAGGIAGGSWAAAWMSTYGGAVPPGSLCALLQRVGARGLSTSMIAAMEGTAVAMATALGAGVRYYVKNNGFGALPLSADTEVQDTILLSADTEVHYTKLPMTDRSTFTDVDDDEDACTTPLLRQPIQGREDGILQVDRDENDDGHGLLGVADTCSSIWCT